MSGLNSEKGHSIKFEHRTGTESARRSRRRKNRGNGDPINNKTLRRTGPRRWKVARADEWSDQLNYGGAIFNGSNRLILPLPRSLLVMT